mgnify:CR=1 FL=1
MYLILPNLNRSKPFSVLLHPAAALLCLVAVVHLLAAPAALAQDEPRNDYERPAREANPRDEDQDREAEPRQAPEEPRQEAMTLMDYTANNKVALYPLAFAGSHFMVGYERGLSDRWSAMLNASIGLSEEPSYYDMQYSPTIGDGELRNMSAYYFELQARYYVIGKLMNGAYFAPYLFYKGINFETDLTVFDEGTGQVSTETETVELNAGAGGVVFGYQLLFKRLTVDFYLGGGMMVGGGDYDQFSTIPFDNYKRGVHLQTGLSFGFTF